MKLKTLNIYNKISLVGLGIVLVSLGILATLETPRDVLREKGKILFFLGTATTFVGSGIDYYVRKKEEKKVIIISQKAKFWQELEQEIYENKKYD